MQDYAEAVMAADAATWSICVGLSMLAAGVLTVFLRGWAKAATFLPGLLAGALMANHAATIMRWDLSADKAMNTIGLATIGMTAGMIVTMALLKTLQAFGALFATPPPRTPQTPQRRRVV